MADDAESGIPGPWRGVRPLEHVAVVGAQGGVRRLWIILLDKLEFLVLI